MMPPLSMLSAGGFRPDAIAAAAGLVVASVIVLGIHWMRSPSTAVRGNRLCIFAMTGLVLLAVTSLDVWMVPAPWAWMLLGGAAGVLLAGRVRMIRMPELIALFNGVGGAASMCVALVTLATALSPGLRVRVAAILAVVIGAVTFSGSAVAVLKLGRLLPAAPMRFRGQPLIGLSLAVLLSVAVGMGFAHGGPVAVWGTLVLSLLCGLVFMLRVGGADMPVSISLLNALSGVAAAVAGYAVGHPVPVAVGAVVGAGGLMLTRLMCRAMNRNLMDVLGGRGRVTSGGAPETADAAPAPATAPEDPVGLLRRAKTIAIIPGYGMALAQAQRAVRRLYDVLTQQGKEVCFVVHPVAGRMPGHMHVLLAEVDLPYSTFLEMDEVNPRFADIDVAVVVGANDVVNPAASTAEGTPIHGMPVVRADEARAVVVCNLDDGPGYAGVPNPLFTLPGTVLRLGNAAETVASLAEALAHPSPVR